MVTLDPCDRLNTIHNQLIPSILRSAVTETTSDIQAAINSNLPNLERTCLELADKCEKNWPDCGKKIKLCDKEEIKELFNKTRQKLEMIWLEKKKLEEIEQAAGS